MAGAGVTGPRRTVSEELEEALRQQHREYPYLTLSGHCKLFEETTGVGMSVATMSNTFRRMKLSAGKRAAVERLLSEQHYKHPYLTLQEHREFLEREHGVSVSINTLREAFGRDGYREVKKGSLEKLLRGQHKKHPEASIEDHVRLLEDDHGLTVSYNTVLYTFEDLGLPLLRGPRPLKAQALSEFLPRQLDANPDLLVREHIELFERNHGIRVSYTYMRRALQRLRPSRNADRSGQTGLPRPS